MVDHGRLRTVDVQVRSRVSPCGICGGQVAMDRLFSVTRLSTVSTYICIRWGTNYRPVCVRSSKTKSRPFNKNNRVGPQWHNIHTKFDLNPSSGSGVESCGRTDMTSPICVYFMHKCKDRIILFVELRTWIRPMPGGLRLFSRSTAISVSTSNRTGLKC
jgi:hypothetical protein